MDAPFILPVRREDDDIISGDGRLIGSIIASSSEAIHYFVEAANSHGQFFIVQGNPFDGMSCIGPFTSHERAAIYAESKLDDWHVVEMKRPE